MVARLPPDARELLEGVRAIGEWGAGVGLVRRDWWRRAVWRYDAEDPEGEVFGGSDSSCYSSDEEAEPAVAIELSLMTYQVE